MYSNSNSLLYTLKGQFDFVAYTSTGPCERAGGHFQDVCRPEDKRAGSQWDHRVMQVHHAPAPVEEQDVNRETHPDRVNGFFAAQEQTLARFEGAVSQESSHSRPDTGGGGSFFHEDSLAGPIERAHSDAQSFIDKDQHCRSQ